MFVSETSTAEIEITQGVDLGFRNPNWHIDNILSIMGPILPSGVPIGTYTWDSLLSLWILGADKAELRNVMVFADNTIIGLALEIATNPYVNETAVLTVIDELNTLLAEARAIIFNPYALQPEINNMVAMLNLAIDSSKLHLPADISELVELVAEANALLQRFYDINVTTNPVLDAFISDLASAESYIASLIYTYLEVEAETAKLEAAIDTARVLLLDLTVRNVLPDVSSDLPLILRVMRFLQMENTNLFARIQGNDDDSFMIRITFGSIFFPQPTQEELDSLIESIHDNILEALSIFPPLAYDHSVLEATIDEALGLVLALSDAVAIHQFHLFMFLYTAEIGFAQNVLDNKFATQCMVDNAVYELNEKISEAIDIINLPPPTVDRSGLRAAIDEAIVLDDELISFVIATMNLSLLSLSIALGDARLAAEAVHNEPLSEQADIDAALAMLNAVMDQVKLILQ
jgi:cyanate lyase